jgi:hypothetical protein
MQWLQNKKRKEKKEKKRVLQKNNSARNPRKKSRKPNCSRRLSSLARKEEYSPISLSLYFFLREALRPVSGALGSN